MIDIDFLKGKGDFMRVKTLDRIVFLLLNKFKIKSIISYSDVTAVMDCSERQARAYLRYAENRGFLHRVSGRPIRYKIIKIPKSVEELRGENNGKDG